MEPKRGVLVGGTSTSTYMVMASDGGWSLGAWLHCWWGSQAISRVPKLLDHQRRGWKSPLKAFVLLGLVGGRSDGAPNLDVHRSSPSPELGTDPDLSFPPRPLPRKGRFGEEMMVKSSCCLPTPHWPPRFTVAPAPFPPFPKAPSCVCSPDIHTFGGITGALHIIFGQRMEGEGLLLLWQGQKLMEIQEPEAENQESEDKSKMYFVWGEGQAERRLF